MKPLGTCAIALMLLGLSVPGRAQSWELSGLVGQTPSAGLDNQAPELTGLSVGDGFTWGAQLTRLFNPRWGAEVSFMQQLSELELETTDGEADLFSMKVGQLHANALFHFGAAESRWRPFLLAGIGATFLSGHELQSETKLSFGLGAGVKYFPWKTIGLRGQVRYKPTLLKDEDAGRYCDPFGFCQGTLQQVEIAVGATVRF